MRNKIYSVIVCTAFLAACDTTTQSASTPASSDAVLGAETSKQLLAMGARQLSGAEIRKELVGPVWKEASEGGWTWMIKSDGTSSSKAADESWSTSATWNIAGNQYCRAADDKPEKCSDVYELGGIYRFSDTDEKLAGWAVVAQ